MPKAINLVRSHRGGPMRGDSLEHSGGTDWSHGHALPIYEYSPVSPSQCALSHLPMSTRIVSNVKKRRHTEPESRCDILGVLPK
jgi:hypothetical protein